VSAAKTRYINFIEKRRGTLVRKSWCTGANDAADSIAVFIADEIERLRADLDKSAKLALSAVDAERAAILELIEAQRADAHLYNAD
jgi:hypothetical protein